jgi:hypothetical protein
MKRIRIPKKLELTLNKIKYGLHFRSGKPRLTAAVIRCAANAISSNTKSWQQLRLPWRLLGRHSSLAD